MSVSVSVSGERVFLGTAEKLPGRAAACRGKKRRRLELCGTLPAAFSRSHTVSVLSVCACASQHPVTQGRDVRLCAATEPLQGSVHLTD